MDFFFPPKALTDCLQLRQALISISPSLRLQRSSTDSKSGGDTGIHRGHSKVWERQLGLTGKRLLRPHQCHAASEELLLYLLSCCPHRKIHNHNFSQPFICPWRVREATGIIVDPATVLPFGAQKLGGRRLAREPVRRGSGGIVPGAKG